MIHSFLLSINLDFTDSIDLYRKIHLFFCSSKNENWFHANSEFVDNGVSVAIESRRIKQFIITFLIKSLKKSYFSFKTRFKVFFWRPILARFVGAQFFQVFRSRSELSHFFLFPRNSRHLTTDLTAEFAVACLPSVSVRFRSKERGT